MKSFYISFQMKHAGAQMYPYNVVNRYHSLRSPKKFIVYLYKNNLYKNSEKHFC